MAAARLDSDTAEIYLDNVDVSRCTMYSGIHTDFST